MLGLALAAAVVAGIPADLPSRLETAAQQYYAAMVTLAPVTGRDVAFDYYERLLNDRDTVTDAANVPAGYSADEYVHQVTQMSSLDLELVARLERAQYGDLAGSHGLHELFVRSSADGTMQPFALYVPRGYDAAKPAPLVVLLHGHQQTETSLLAAPYLRALADETGTVVAAPYGRAYYDFTGSALRDVYDVADAVSSTLAIDRKRRYLAGYSMGGFSVFMVAPERVATWAAIMSVSGGAMGHDLPTIRRTLKEVPLYVVTGTADDSIPSEYTQRTAHYLANSGFVVSLYVNPGGTHRMITNLPALTRAWNDMHAGVFRELAVDYRWTMPGAAPPAASVKN